MNEFAQVLEELREVRKELRELRAEVAPVARRRDAVKGFTAVEAAHFLGMDRKTFYRRAAPLLSRDPITKRFPVKTVEAIRAMIGG